MSVLLLLFISVVILSCFYYCVHQKSCTVRRDQNTIENATSANQDTLENATSADTPTEGIYSLISRENIHTIYDTGTEFEEYQNNDMSAMNEPNSADYSRITFVTNDKKHQDIQYASDNYSRITFERLMNDKKCQDIQHAPDNYSMITFESLKTHQDIQHDPEPLDIPDWGKGDTMAYQNVTTLMKNMDTSKALPNFYESSFN